MPELRIHYSGGRIVPVRVSRPEVVIGRDASCDLVLEDAITSRQHARFSRDDKGGYWIHDLQSKNGTTLNNRQVKRSRVRHGDRIGIGDCFLTFDAGAAETQVVLKDPVSTGSATTSAWDTSHRLTLPQQRLEKLYELNERLTGRFDRDDLLSEVLDICIELLRFERAGVAVWRGDPSPPEWVTLRNLRADPSGEFHISRSMVDKALHRAERILLNDSAAAMADPTASIISNHIQSAMCVPMMYLDRVRGVIYGDRVSTTGGYTHEDIDFFAALGRLGAMGLANVQLLDEMTRRRQVETQVQWARKIQTDLFPAEPLIREGLHITGLNDPGRSVSGDYYDYFVRPDGLIAVVIADVMGKGIPASLLTANLQAAVHVKLETETDLPGAVDQLNRLICGNVSESRFITALFGLLDPARGIFTYVNAGHMPPYRLRPGGRVECLSMESALPLGVEAEYRYRQDVFDLSDRPVTLFLYTDGIPDAENDDEARYETDRLVESLRSNTDHAPDALLTRVRASIKQFTRNHAQTDDITLLAIRLD